MNKIYKLENLDGEVYKTALENIRKEMYNEIDIKHIHENKSPIDAAFNNLMQIILEYERITRGKTLFLEELTFMVEGSPDYHKVLSEFVKLTPELEKSLLKIHQLWYDINTSDVGIILYSVFKRYKFDADGNIVNKKLGE